MGAVSRHGTAWPAYAAGAGAVLCWASLAAAIGESLRVLPPAQVLFLGLLIAGVGLSAWQAWRGGRPLPAWPGWRVALLGVYGIWGFHTLLVLALSLAPPVEANILNYTWPLWIVLLGTALPGHRLRPTMVLGAVAAFGGVVLVIAGPRLGGGPAALDFASAHLGLGLALGAGLCWGSFTVLLRYSGAAKQPLMGLFSLLSALPAGVIMVLGGTPPLPPPAYWPPLLYLGLIPLGLSFLLWERAVRTANVQTLGVLSFFTPLLSTLLLSAVSGAPVKPTVWGGLACILAGSLLAGWGERRQRRSGATTLAGKESV